MFDKRKYIKFNNIQHKKLINYNERYKSIPFLTMNRIIILLEFILHHYLHIRW